MYAFNRDQITRILRQVPQPSVGSIGNRILFVLKKVGQLTMNPNHVVLSFNRTTVIISKI